MKYRIARLILSLPAILLATSFSSNAQPVAHVCKNVCLNGSYGFLMTGQAFSTACGFVANSDSGSLTWDGSSKVTGSSTQNVDGQSSSRTFTGTYTVNSDC